MKIPKAGAAKEYENEQFNKMIKSVFQMAIVIGILSYFFSYILCFGCPVSGSMEPTLATGKMYISSCIPYFFNKPARGDIIIFKHGDVYFGKRVVAIEGDTIEFHDGDVYINDELIDESEYLPFDTDTNCAKSFTVPEGKLFVMGDNREDSNDSREWDDPFVSINVVRAKVLYSQHLEGLEERQLLGKDECTINNQSEWAPFLMAYQDTDEIVYDYIWFDSTYAEEAGIKAIESHHGNKKEPDEGMRFVVFRYALTVNPTEEYVDIKLLGTDGKNLSIDGKTYSSKVFDMYDGMKYKDGIYMDLLSYFEIPQDYTGEYMIKVGNCLFEHYGLKLDNATANYILQCDL